MVEDLRIAAWNANGLLNHQHELQMFLDMQKIDVCLISETHFTQQSFIKMRGYQMYHTIHPLNSARGGAAVIVKNSISHYEESGVQTEEFQVTAIKIKTKVNKHGITIAALYCPPRHSLKKEDYSACLQSLGSRFVVGGDFNAKHTYWGSRLITPKGKELFMAAREMGCYFHSTGRPTYWPADRQKIPDLIDFFIVRKVGANYIKVEENYDLSSDHSPIIMTLSDKVIKKENNPFLVNKLTDWDGFRNELEARIRLNVPLKTCDQLEYEAEIFMNDVQQAAWANTPQIKRKTVGNNYPKEIKELVVEKRKIRRRWQQFRNPADKTMLNNLCQRLKREIKEIKNEAINSYLNELSTEMESGHSLWKAIRRFKRPIIQCPPIKKPNGEWARDDHEKADVFASHLEKIFQTHESQENGENRTLGENSEEDIISLTSPKEVSEEIKKNINPKKAPGFDLITGEILKQLPRRGIVKLTNLFNAAFRLRYVPRIWKVAEVIMIAKEGKPPNEVSSYRPISLLPIIAKLFEKLFLKRLKPIIERKELIPTHQFGFRSQHSTIDQVHRMTDVIEKTLEEGKICAAVLLDVAQAFDRVWHAGLIHKMKQILPRYFSQLLESYISERSFRIKQNTEYSDLKDIRAGVPQGSVLGPVLYLLYTHDIPQTPGTLTATFADDTAILAVSDNIENATSKLQGALNNIHNWTKRWRIKLNETKSIHINFTNRKVQYLPITINNNSIPHANTAKYLGMTLDTKLRWKVHVKKKKEQLNLKYKSMYWMLGRRSGLTVQNKVLIYQQVLKPIWTYGIQLWGCTKKSNRECLEVFQNKVLRSIVNAPWYSRNEDIRRDLNVESVSAEIARFAKKHEDRLHQHVNLEALQLLDNTCLVRRLKRTKPFELV